MTRQTKTPRQRAEETLAVAQRRVDKLQRDYDRAREVAKDLDRQLQEADARLAYVKSDPALPVEPAPITDTTGGTTA